MLKRLLRIIARRSHRRIFADGSKSMSLQLTRDDFHEYLRVSFVDADTGRSVSVLLPPIHWTALARVSTQLAAFKTLRDQRAREQSGGRFVLYEEPEDQIPAA